MLRTKVSTIFSFSKEPKFTKRILGPCIGTKRRKPNTIVVLYYKTVHQHAKKVIYFMNVPNWGKVKLGTPAMDFTINFLVNHINVTNTSLAKRFQTYFESLWHPNQTT